MSSALIISFKRLEFLLACALTIGNSTFATAIVQSKNEPKEIWLGDVLGDGDLIEYRGYVLTKRHRSVVDPEIALKPIDVSYAVLNRKGKRLMKFDADVYFGLGNATRFGLVSILGNHKQAIISQDVYRGGAQWIVTLSRHPRIIFDGRIWSVGREGDDLGLGDLDGDDVYEISVPITDFYQLHDKMPMSQIPLPSIIFRYHRVKRTYLPANRRFRTYLLQDLESIDSRLNSSDPFAQKSAVLKKLLTYIYIGRRREGWRFFDRTYALDDREEIRRRVKSILRRQPVYRFIYKHPGKRR
ncbi:MAG TPA: hypothetical protein VFZ40_15035 [Pyrinomonadaceae bacterium]